MDERLFKDLKTYLVTNRIRESFPVMLDRLREERGMKPPDLYKRAGVNRRYYWKIMGQRHPNINKKMAIAYGLALELDRETMDALLRSAGYALSNNSGFDLVVMFCVERRIYDFFEICHIAQTICEAAKIPVQGEEVYAGKPEVDIDIEQFDTTEDAGNADQTSKKQEPDNIDFQGDNFTDLLEKITESLDDFTEKLGDGWDSLEEPSVEEDMREDEAAVYQKVQRVAEPLVSMLNSMAEKLERAAFEIIDK